MTELPPEAAALHTVRHPHVCGSCLVQIYQDKPCETIIAHTEIQQFSGWIKQSEVLKETRLVLFSCSREHFWKGLLLNVGIWLPLWETCNTTICTSHITHVLTIKSSFPCLPVFVLHKEAETCSAVLLQKRRRVFHQQNGTTTYFVHLETQVKGHKRRSKGNVLFCTKLHQATSLLRYSSSVYHDDQIQW